MNINEKVEPAQEAEAPVAEATNSIDSLPESAQKEIRKLREENARRRVENKEEKEELTRLKELEARVKEQEEKKLEEEGKYKELLEQSKQELEALKPLKDLNEKYESSFKQQLENELKGLSENMVSMVNKAGGNYAERLEYAKAIKAEMSVGKNSPGFEAPGTSYTGGDHKSLLDQLNKETDLTKKAEMLFELKKKDKKLYNQI